jgi:hypothetical protein
MIRVLRSRGKPLAPTALAMAALAGCAGDNARYACAGYPSAPLCLPPSAIYSLTEGQGPSPAAQPRPGELDGAVGRATGADTPGRGTGPTARGTTP